MNEQQLKQVIGHLAEEFVPDEVNVWPSILLQMKMDKEYVDRGDHSMNTFVTRSRYLRLVVLSLIALSVLIVVSVLTIPPLQTVAREVLGFSTKTKDIQTVFTPTPVITLNPVYVPTDVQTIEQQMNGNEQMENGQTSPNVDYQIKLPSMLPKDWKMEKIEMGMNGNAWVNFVYEPGGSLLYLIINPSQDIAGTILGPDDKVETVRMGNITGEYVRGSWTIKDGHGILHQVTPEEVKDLVWSDDPGMRKLCWTDGNLNYLLVSSGASAGEPGYLGKIDLSVIADSFKPVSPGPWPTQQIFTSNNGADEIDQEVILTPNQLESLAGFDILEPAYLPENFHYNHGEYYSLGGNAVDLYYSCGDNSDLPWGYNFYIYQVKMSEAEYQWELDQAPKDEVGESAQIETVLIKGVPAEFIKGYWQEVIDTSSSTPVPVQRIWDNNINYYSLKWYANGVFYMMRSGSWGDNMPTICLLTKEDIINIAQSLK
jgi:hypothetical protein